MNNAILYHYAEVGDPLVEKLFLHVQRGESFVLLGYQGGGKRQAVGRLGHLLKSEGRPYVAVWFEDTVPIVTEAELVAALRRRMQHFLSEELVEALSHAKTLLEWFYCLGQYSNGSRLAVGFANIDLIAQSLKERFLALARSAVENRHIVVCLTGESVLARTLGGESSPFECVHQYVLTGHDKPTAQEFFLKRVRFCGLRFNDPNDPTWTPEAAFDAFYEHTGGNLNLLRAILWCLSERRLRFDENPDEHRGFPRGIVEESFSSYTAVPLFGLRIFHSVITFIQQERTALARIEELLDQVQSALDMGAGLRSACLSASVTMQGAEPEPLELAGFLQRSPEKQRLFFPSFYVAEFVFRYFSWTCRGDFHAKQGDWEKAFECYEKVDARERQTRPLGEQDFRIVRAIVNRLCREFAERITEENATTRLRVLWDQCGRLLFGLKSAVVLRLDDKGTWVVEPGGGSGSDRFNKRAKEVLQSAPIPSSRKEPDVAYSVHMDAAKRVLIVQGFPGTPELKPRHALLMESEAFGPDLDGLRLRLLETVATNFLTCYNEARLRRRMWRSRLRLGEAMQQLFAYNKPRESLEALGKYLHDEFLATGAWLFLIEDRTGNLRSAKSWGLKDPVRRKNFDSGGLVLPTGHDAEAWAALKEGEPIAFRWCPGGQVIPPPTTDLHFRQSTDAQTKHTKRKPGDYWIDFPLFVGEEPYGKLTLDFSSDAPPPARYLDDLNAISAILSWHLKRLNLDGRRLAEMRSLQQRAVAVVAHDLATRIANLPVFLRDYDLFASPLKGSVRQEIDAINRRFGDALQAAMDVLDRAKKRLQEVRPAYETVDLIEIVGEALKSIEFQGGVARLHVINPAADKTIVIDADRFHIHGVFCELVSDSQTMQSPAVPVEVTVCIERRDSDDRVVIDYRDNGPGVPDDLKERIFDYLTSYRPGHTRKGLGLGLGYVRETIEAHRGSIREHGKHGGGVHFQIEIPIHQNIEREQI